MPHMEQQLSTLTVTDAAEQRRSIRKYKPEPIPEADLREIIRVASLAPSAFNAQPWRFVVARDPELVAALGRAAHGQRQFATAPAVIVLYSDMRDVLDTVDETIHPGMQGKQRERARRGFVGVFGSRGDADREAWGAGQSFIALGYLLLAAQSLGYATSPMAGFDPAEVKRVLGLPGHVAVPAMVTVGIADEEGFTTHRHPVDRIADFR